MPFPQIHLRLLIKRARGEETLMNYLKRFDIRSLMLVLACAVSSSSMAFESGSTGVDGVLNPIVDTTIQLPENGILNYTSINIPADITVRFTKNTTNTPAKLLVSGDINIEGTLDVSALPSANIGAAGDGNVGDDGIAGISGPGGFDGGRGGDINDIGGSELGPGGAFPGPSICAKTGFGYENYGAGGGGGGFAAIGDPINVGSRCVPSPAQGGDSYGSNSLLPIVDGSGGGGGHGGLVFKGSGGGGGGGAILIACSGTVSITGSIRADGGKSGDSSGLNAGGSGGGGSGGAIRIIATAINGNGAISAKGGLAGSAFGRTYGGKGSAGRIRLEAETITRIAVTNPAYSFSDPQAVLVAGLPALRIVSVAGATAPVSPSGSADIVLPETTPNPVTVVFETTNIPIGNTVTLTLIPSTGDRTSIISNAISGSEASGTADTSINLPSGPSVLAAQVSFTVSASLGNDLSRFAKGEQVEHVRVAATLQGQSTTLITVAGNEYIVPSKTVGIH